MMDFRALSYFVAACEHDNLGSAAQTLAIAPSSLSASLKSLEAQFGVPLLRKSGGGVSPRRLGHWLYRAAVPVLVLEAFARRRALAPGAVVSRLTVSIKLHFAFGDFRQAFSKAIAATASAEPLALVDPHWPNGPGDVFDRDATDCLGFDEDSAIEIDVVPRTALAEQGEVALHEDQWISVRRALGPKDGASLTAASSKYLVPALPEMLIEQIHAWARQAAINPEFLDASPRDWPQILDDHPGATLLLPASAIGTRLGVMRVDTAPLDPPLRSTIVGKSDGHPLALRFFERIKAAFGHDGPSPAFAPALTRRRIQYFNLAYNLGGISAAARSANVAQPALSQQLRKLEESLGTALFDRRTFGLSRNEQCTHFALATNVLDRQLGEMEVSGNLAALAKGGRLRLGVLPSVSQNGLLVQRITDAVLGLRARYSRVHVMVREAPNSVLQKAVQRGEIGLAIVETVVPQMPRLTLDASEDLAVIAHPRHAILPAGPVRLCDLSTVPLALPTRSFGLRQLLDAATRAAGIELLPLHEIDALPMLVALLAREPIATILPASAVASEIVNGDLCAHVIIEPNVSRRLFVIHSGDRPLAPIERDLVQSLRSLMSAPAARSPADAENLMVV